MSPQDRARALVKMQEQEFDLAVIGGGITGAGVARDAASRGMSVALIEGSDFASGTSSRSSKLIHGGIRYLENFEFHLVFEALSERQLLFAMAPHLVHPLRFLIPIYKTGRVPAWKMGLGMMAYDALSLYEAPELHQHLAAEEIARAFPFLKTTSLEGGFTYADAYMDDDRLVHETLRSARAHGAHIANYVRATGGVTKDGRIRELQCTDLQTDKSFRLKARHVVGSVGPWTDQLGLDLLGQKVWKQRLRPSKGIHLTFERSRFALEHAVVMGAEKRIVFAIPRHEMVIVGTTDTDFKAMPDKVRTEPEDVAYVLKVIADYFPGANITSKDVVGTYAGVRPLIDDGSQTESKTSREHEIWTDPAGITFVAGGKYTTYRRMAEQTVVEVLRHFSIEERIQFGKSQTTEPLNPLVTENLLKRAKAEHAEWALPVEISAPLAERHGLEARAIIDEALKVIPAITHLEEWRWCAEALHAVRKTMCLNLTDFYVRRTPLILSRPDHGLPFASAIAQVMGAELGWSFDETQTQINALQNQIAWDLAAVISN